MKTREVESLLRKIAEKANALADLQKHTKDLDLLRTAVNSLHNATQAFLETTDA